MTKIFAFLIIILLIVVIPVLTVTLLVRLLMRKRVRKLVIIDLICVGMIIPLTIGGVLTDPKTWEKKAEPVEKEEVIKEDTPIAEEVDEPNEKPVEEPKEKTNDWKSVFSEKGFSEEEISSYEEILTNVGITDYHDVEVIENGRMHIIRGKIFDSKNLQVNMTLEERKIILVELAGIPATEKEAYINWRGKLKFNTVGTTTSVDLYYDMSGGYVAKYDNENNVISPYNE